MIVDHNARRVAAQDLNEHFIGQTFACETKAGFVLYGRIAFIENRTTSKLSPVVNVTVDGVRSPEGGSLVLVFSPTEELFFSAPSD